MKNDLCVDAARRCFVDLLEMNGCLEVRVREEEEHLVQRVMETREGLDDAKVREMVRALWDCPEN